MRNIVLLAFSLLFYAWSEPVYVWLMVFSICFNWAFGFAISKSATPPRKFLLVADLFLNLLILGFY